MGEPGIAPRGEDFASELEEHLFAQFRVENSLRFGETGAQIVEKLPTGKRFLIDLALGAGHERRESDRI